MAVITGISGMQIGDGAGGKAALSVIQGLILRILSDMRLTYLAATINNPHEMKAGTAHYYVPEILQTEEYGTGNTAFQTPQINTREIKIDKRIDVKWEVEDFDLSRISQSGALMAQVATGVAMAIQHTLNAEFYKELGAHFAPGAQLNNQVIKLDNLGTVQQAGFNPDDMFTDYLKLEYKLAEINQTFDKRHLGIPKAEVLAILSPKCDIGLRLAFRNQPNQIGTWQVSKTLEGRYIGNVKYIVEKMMQKQITAGTSFSKDHSYNFTNFLGFLMHNEAAAFPINLNKLAHVTNPDNANQRVICKVQYGFGVLRPELIWALTDTQINAAPYVDKKKKE